MRRGRSTARRGITMCGLAYLIITTAISPQIARSQITDPTELYRNSQTHRPYVIFAARDGVPGHAFTVLGEELDNGLLWNLAVFGFYPDGGVKKQIASLVSAPGKIDYHWEDLTREVEFRVAINAEQSSKIRSILETWESESYSLLDNNCNKLVSEIASSIGLSLPSDDPGTTLPAIFVAKLKSANETKSVR